MSRGVPKSKRAAYVYDRDFIVVDDISGVWKMRSQCAIDGYGFLSANGDPRHPQETPPDIREDMAAWPDPRPVSPAVYVPEPGYVYFVVQYEIVDVQQFHGFGTTTFSAANTICFNAPLSTCTWTVDGVLAATGIEVTLTLSGPVTHTIVMEVTDIQGHAGSLTFTYDQPYIPHSPLIFNYASVIGGNGTYAINNAGRQLVVTAGTLATAVEGLQVDESYTAGAWFIAFGITGTSNLVDLGMLDSVTATTAGIIAQVGILSSLLNLDGIAIDSPSINTQNVGTVATLDQFILYFDATGRTWGIVTPDDVQHDLTSLGYAALATMFTFFVNVNVGEAVTIDLLLNTELSLTPPVGYENAAEA